MGIVVREMLADDLGAVMELEQVRQVRAWPRVGFEQALRLKQFCVVAEDRGDVAGYFVADMRDGHGRTICSIRPAVAVRLYKAWFEASAAAGLRHLYGEIEESNVRSIRMIEHYGFKKIGVRPHFYGVGKSAVAYYKVLESISRGN